jgi:hypothetical protein
MGEKMATAVVAEETRSRQEQLRCKKKEKELEPALGLTPPVYNRAWPAPSHQGLAVSRQHRAAARPRVLVLVGRQEAGTAALGRFTQAGHKAARSPTAPKWDG